MATHAVVNDVHAAVRDYLNQNPREDGQSDADYALAVLANLFVMPLLAPDTRYESLQALAREKAQHDAEAHLAEAVARKQALVAELDQMIEERTQKLTAAND